MITKTQSDNIENQEILRRHPEVYSTAAIPLSKSFSYWGLEYFLPLTQSLLLLLLLYRVLHNPCYCYYYYTGCPQGHLLEFVLSQRKTEPP